jgi:alpha-beta hydrolase superfamily lysophospholipase
MSTSQITAYLSSKTNNSYSFFTTCFLLKAKATCLIVHGMQEHSGRYAEIAEYFSAHGIAVLTYDHLGHGNR